MKIYGKIAKAKAEIGKIAKDSTNPFFKSKYFDINALLEHVEPILLKHGLMVLQPIIDNVVTTQLIDSENGDKIISEMRLSDLKDVQKLGSEITYLRRYTLQSLLSIQAEDDDGNKAVAPTPTPAPKKVEPTKLPEAIKEMESTLTLEECVAVWNGWNKQFKGKELEQFTKTKDKQKLKFK